MSLPIRDGSETWGRGSEFGIVPLADGRIYWFATANLPECSRFADEYAEVVARFAHWHAPIGEVLRATLPDAVLRHDIYELPRPYPPHSRGRLALLGDAAHAMTPNAGQGGCQTFEDAVVLATCIGDGDVRRGLADYDRLRRPRTQRTAAASAAIGRLIQRRQMTRDAVVRLTPPTLALRTISRLLQWDPSANRP